MDNKPLLVEFPGEGGNLILGVSGYEMPHAEHGSEANWLDGCIALQAGAFRGEYVTAFTTYELDELREELFRAVKGSAGVVTFESTEAELSLRIELCGEGRAVVSGVAMPANDKNGYLTFRIGSGLATLTQSLAQLDRLLHHCPVRRRVPG